MPVLIIESPNKIKKLQSILGSTWTILASKGHVIDLPVKKIGIDIKGGFIPQYEVLDKSKKTLSELQAATKSEKIVYLGTDPDREGEAISSLLSQNLGKKEYRRVRFHAITKASVTEAVKNYTQIDQNLCDAQQARRVTDRLVGYKISPQMWIKGLTGASAGRVQSVALKYIVDRDREISSFIKEEYWDIYAHLENGVKPEFYGRKKKPVKILNKTQADEIVSGTLKKKMKVTDVKESVRIRAPLPPYTTASLQQDGSTILGMSVDKVMESAQKLFEQGAITYHRTDSVSVDKQALTDMRDHIESSHGRELIASTPNTYESKKASQEAHECIRPTSLERVEVPKEYERVYNLIRDRYLASQMADARYQQVKVEFDVEGLSYRITGSRLLFEGFLKVYGSQTQDVILPVMSIGDEYLCTKVDANQKWTQPPAKYSEAAIVKRMEADGVGRPATYAATIKTLVTRKYIDREGKSLQSTEFGRLVCDYLTRFYPKVVDPLFTAQMEEGLDDIAEGKKTYVGVLTPWYTDLADTIKVAAKGDVKDLMRTPHKCPVCESGYFLKRPSESGWWYSCDGYPECKTVALKDDKDNIQIEGGVVSIKVEEAAPENTTDEEAPLCPKCDVACVLKESKFGKFWSCPNFKTGCKKTIPYGAKTVYEGIQCPECEQGMYETKGRFGSYLKCIDTGCKGTCPIPIGKCPKCSKALLKRYARKKKAYFNACIGWPDTCDYTQSVSK
jgi:DNA topoisomerase-1